MAATSDQRAALGQRIKAARLARLLTQREVAERAGIGRDALAKYETGARGIGVDELMRLAAALRTPVAALLGEAPPAAAAQPPTLAPPLDTIVRILTEHPDFTPQVLEMLELLLEREADSSALNQDA
jgi:transcriptional regulator with XRE-family HTH domain